MSYLVSCKHASKGIHFALLTTNPVKGAPSKQFFNIKLGEPAPEPKRGPVAILNSTQVAANLALTLFRRESLEVSRVSGSGKQWSKKGSISKTRFASFDSGF